MNDGIIKNDGTSRFLAGSFPATYEEFRQLAEQKKLPVDVLFNAAGWSTIPDFLNKGNLWKDATAALFGLGANSVPDDGFAWLGKYNQYWWRRISYKLSFGSEDNLTIFARDSSSSLETYAGRFRYSDSVVVKNNTAELVEPVKSIAISYGLNYSTKALNGKYFIFEGSDTSNSRSALVKNAVYYGTSGCSRVTSTSYGNYGVQMSCKRVITEKDKEEYVQSSDRYAYPDSGEQDGYEYQYFGIPFDDAVGALKCETGSYVGTGTYGQNNPNSLTFGFVPKIVFITCQVNPGNPNYGFHREAGVFFTAFIGQSYPDGGFGYYYLDFNGSSNDYSKLNGTTLTWYNTSSADGQLNLEKEYRYLAIG